MNRDRVEVGWLIQLMMGLVPNLALCNFGNILNDPSLQLSIDIDLYNFFDIFFVDTKSISLLSISIVTLASGSFNNSTKFEQTER